MLDSLAPRPSKGRAMKEGRKKNSIFIITKRSETSTKINVLKKEVLKRREKRARMRNVKESIKSRDCVSHRILSSICNIKNPLPKQAC